MTAPAQATALALIAAGGVAADQHGSIFLPDGVDTTTVGEVRLLVVMAIARSLAYRNAAAGTPGVFPVLLTTLGEAVLRRGNPADYASKHAFGVRDGKVEASEVRS
ncbi:hypothetical protein [Micromonospora carbonacea]|uniref:Uncharacterized protein n=1 Tax=Micromonospora carbonacea TaxID=47853 RepID=A0A1C5AAI1_9ACTN|nr:hypothetical protein [Micromonospora carbonacea]SCF42159.1 hypothetical protein GA0070563_11245 [Micromonospora carbonacea]